MATSGGITYENFSNITKVSSINTLGNDASQNLQVKMPAGAWTHIRYVDFGELGASSFTVRAKGTGTLEIRLNQRTNAASATIEFSSTSFENHTIELDPTVFKGRKHLFFVFTESNNVQFDTWQFTQFDPDAIETPTIVATPSESVFYNLSGQRLNNLPQQGIVIEQYTGTDGKRYSRKVVME